MKIAVAKMLFTEGVLSKSQAVQNPMGAGYVLELFRSSAQAIPEAMQTDKGETRVFKTADAVLKTAHDIGFKEVLFVG